MADLRSLHRFVAVLAVAAGGMVLWTGFGGACVPMPLVRRRQPSPA